jgi:hypothetical protein
MMKIMAEQREDDELKELTFTVKVKVQVRADLPEEGLRVEGAELHLVRGEGASKAYPQTRVRWMEFSSALESAPAGGPAIPQPGEATPDYCGPCRSGNHDKCYEPCLCRARKHMPAPASAGGEALPPVTDEELAKLLREADRLTPELQHPYRAMAWRLARSLEKARGDLAESRVYEAAVTAVELQRDVRKFLEELASSYTHDAVDHRDHRVSRDICRRCRTVRLLKALEELQQK